MRQNNIKTSRNYSLYIGAVLAVSTFGIFMSCNDKFVESQTVFDLPVDKTMQELLAGYDTDGYKKITKDDATNKD